jgi:signal transduction histidine kinase
VFQAFRRGIHEENGAVKGAGLGLAICKGLVEAHGGRIWIKKKTTPGTTVSFTLPLVPSHVPDIFPGEA